MCSPFPCATAAAMSCARVNFWSWIASTWRSAKARLNEPRLRVRPARSDRGRGPPPRCALSEGDSVGRGPVPPPDDHRTRQRYGEASRCFAIFSPSRRRGQPRFLRRAAKVPKMAPHTAATGTARGYRREAPSERSGVGSGRALRQPDQRRFSGAAACRRHLQLRGRRRRLIRGRIYIKRRVAGVDGRVAAKAKRPAARRCLSPDGGPRDLRDQPVLACRPGLRHRRGCEHCLAGPAGPPVRYAFNSRNT